MCRYAVAPYKTSMVCVPCRHVAQGNMRCPFCREDMVNAGRDFQAPRKRDDSGWAAVAHVLASGQNYDSCGCDGPGYRPRTGAQVRQDAMTRAWPSPNRKGVA
jgi:hypothetical protein